MALISLLVSLWIMVKKNVKDTIWHWKNFRGSEANGIKYNKVKIKRLHFINKKLCEKNEARAYINTVDEAMLKYY